ncbi:MAG TPA: PLP-dependent transferase [Chitinispirillaceae bacterium]|nr:PLP-dependent transferase [Chitinispirillaceae bacterium]
MKGFSSKAIHGVISKKDVHGTLRFPLYDSAAFEAATAKDLEFAFEGKKLFHTYSRISNPTVDDFEQRIRVLTDSFGVVAVSSGMAAIAETVFALTETGSNIITSRFLFGNTISLFEKTFKRWGLHIKYADMTEPQSILPLIDENTRLIFLESITNPQLEVADVEKITSLVKIYSIPVVLDGTLTTPYLFNSKKAGVAIEIISSTKYISGGATTIGGLIIDNGSFDWNKVPALSDDARKAGPAVFLMRLRREIHRNLGSCISPHNAWLQVLGLETLALRIEKSSRNALLIAEFLSNNSKVRKVVYPGLPNSKSYDIAKKQFRSGFGGILVFELNNKEDCFRFIDNLTIIRRATNLNDNKTLIIHPASTIFCDYSAEEREKMLVTDRLIRLSVGIEDIDDLIDDLQTGLESI